MNVEVNPGKYVIAVSGGVDSVVLLDVLSRLPDLDLLIAHFDHGIRPDSADDAQFVRELARQYDLPFAMDRVELGPDASEDVARTVRYDFLDRISCQHGDSPIILAHHQDDLLETAIHNLIRGTGRRGLTSLRSTDHLKRPLLHLSKNDLLDYALQQKLSWRDDTSNHDERYTRNYIRHRLLVRFDADARQQLLSLITGLTAVNDELDAGLAEQLAAHTTSFTLDRRWFASLPHGLAKECLATWLRSRGLRDYTSSGLERMTVGIKVGSKGKHIDIGHGYYFTVDGCSVKFLHVKTAI